MTSQVSLNTQLKRDVDTERKQRLKNGSKHQDPCALLQNKGTRLMFTAKYETMNMNQQRIT